MLERMVGLEELESWKIIRHCLMWCIWWERNGRKFEDRELTIEDIQQPYLTTLFE
jgi:hypothetical protein